MIDPVIPRSRRLVKYTENGQDQYLLADRIGPVNVLDGCPCDRFGRKCPGGDKKNVLTSEVKELADLSLPTVVEVFQECGHELDELQRQLDELQRQKAELEAALVKVEDVYNRLLDSPNQALEATNIKLERLRPTRNDNT